MPAKALCKETIAAELSHIPHNSAYSWQQDSKLCVPNSHWVCPIFRRLANIVPSATAQKAANPIAYFTLNHIFRQVFSHNLVKPYQSLFTACAA